jgi:hypothetical protein
MATADVQQAARLLTACTVDALSEAALQAEASVCFAECMHPALKEGWL